MANNRREEWVRQLRRMADPVLEALRQRVLKQAMPVESAAPRSDCTHMEAFGRLLCGIAPWLELGPDGSDEGALRRRYAELTLEAVAAAVDPASPDYLWAPPDEPKPNLQLLVDTAFFAHALVRAPRRLIGGMTPELRKLTADLLIRSRVITPGPNNWLLFSAMVEAALRKMGFPADSTRMAYALRQHDQWFKGDGVYGDGRNFAFDYYNSFVIHPMYIETLEIITEAGKHKKIGNMPGCNYHEAIKRAQRFGIILERLISPEGTLPVVGRSITYRTGSLQTLALLAWRHWLPKELPNGQVRSAMTAVIKRMFGDNHNFNEKGFLTLGFNGSQPDISDYYTNNGSLYMASLAFLPLGLPADAPFWTDAPLPWTSKKAWEGEDFPKDHSYHRND